MPLEYTLDHEKRRLVVVWRPPVELDDVVATAERQAADGAWSYGVLHDFRALVTTTRSADSAGARQVLDIIKRIGEKHGKRGPVAIVATGSTVGTAQAYAILGERQGTQETQVFWDREDAEAWLDAHQPEG